MKWPDPWDDQTRDYTDRLFLAFRCVGGVKPTQGATGVQLAVNLRHELAEWDVTVILRSA